MIKRDVGRFIDSHQYERRKHNSIVRSTNVDSLQAIEKISLKIVVFGEDSTKFTVQVTVFSTSVEIAVANEHRVHD